MFSQDPNVYFNVVGWGWGASRPDVGAETLMFILTSWGEGNPNFPDTYVYFNVVGWGGTHPDQMWGRDPNVYFNVVGMG